MALGVPHMVLTGLMGAGKTTVAGALSERLGRPVRDSDDDISRLWGVTGADLANQHGVPRLHEIERGLLLGALAVETPTIITAAASTVDDALCRDAMRRRAFVGVLQAPVDVLVERAAAGSHRRDIDVEEFAALARRRGDLFAEVSDLTVDSRRPIDELVAAVVAALSESQRAS